jgi:antitoxin component YwqK of YwqJK toxin-antitoxin module
MSLIYGKPAEDWNEENRPENGLFRAYWADDGEGISLEDTGYGLRYEWYYKDGLKDGTSRGWYQGGKLKNIKTFKDGQKHGLFTEWYENGKKRVEMTYKDGEWDGLYTEWDKDGQVVREDIYSKGVLKKMLEGERP